MAFGLAFWYDCLAWLLAGLQNNLAPPGWGKVVVGGG